MLLCRFFYADLLSYLELTLTRDFVFDKKNLASSVYYVKLADVMNEMLSHYENLASSYHLNRDSFDLSPLFDAFYQRLGCPSSGLLLDLGCGAGDGFPHYFIQHGWQVEGVDFSSKMLELCHQYHPEMQTQQCDLSKVEISPNRYDLIESIYALFHLPNDCQMALLQKCYEGLKEGGYLYFTYATQSYTGAASYEGTVNFMGSPLFYAHREPEVLRTCLEQIGFSDICMDAQDIAGECFLWVSARKDP